MYRLVKQINTTKSSWMKNIKTTVLKDALQKTVEQLTLLINFSVQTNRIPQKWKEASVVHIRKKGDLKLVGNYRPVSLLPIPSKILEKPIHAQVEEFMENNELLSNSQIVFRKHRSTLHAITELTNTINN